jgi:hypothetical protein
MNRSRPWHFGHSRISTSNVLWRSCGHRRRGEVAYSSPSRRRDQCRTLKSWERGSSPPRTRRIDDRRP